MPLFDYSFPKCHIFTRGLKLSSTCHYKQVTLGWCPDVSGDGKILTAIMDLDTSVVTKMLWWTWRKDLTPCNRTGLWQTCNVQLLTPERVWTFAQNALCKVSSSKLSETDQTSGTRLCSSVSLRFYAKTLQGRGGVEPIPAVISWKVEYNWTGGQSDTR